MSSTYSNLKFELITTGEQSGAWGGTTNTNIGTAIEQAIVGMATLTSADFAANVATLTLIDTNSLQNARALCLNIAAGAVSAAGTINVPAIQKPYLIINGSSFTVTVKVAGLTGVAVPAGRRTVVYNNGTDVGDQISYLSNLTLGAALPIASGGTGTTATQFVNLASNVTGNLPVNNLNGGSAASSTSFWRGDGSWTPVNLSNSVTGNLSTANLNSGTSASSGTFWRGDGLWSPVSLTTNVTGTLPIANGGTGTTSTTFANLTTNVTGTLPVANGGTGTVTPALVAGTNVSITGTWPNQTINSSNSGGTVTSVATSGSVNGITLSGGPITSTGTVTLGGTLSGVSLATQVTGTLPIANGGTGTTSTTFANLATNVTGTLPIANGGTNSTATATAGGIGYGTGTAHAYTSAGTAGQVVVSAGSSAPAFGVGAATTPVVVAFSASSMVVNCALSNVFTATFTGNVSTAPSLTNPVDGQTINWFITQDGTGGRTIVWPGSFKWPGGAFFAGVLSTSANAVDMLSATYRSSTGFWYATLLKGFA